VIMPARTMSHAKATPICFTSDLAPEVAAGVKTMTRRLMPPVKHPHWTAWTYYPDAGIAIETGPDYPDGDDDELRCPYGRPGDLLWQREKHALFDSRGEASDSHNAVLALFPDGAFSIRERRALPVKLSGDLEHGRLRSQAVWRSGRFLPRWGSRATLRVEEIGIEQVQRITEADAVAEGMSLGLLFPLLERRVMRVRPDAPSILTVNGDPYGIYCGVCGRRSMRSLTERVARKLAYSEIRHPNLDLRRFEKPVDSSLECKTCRRALDHVLTGPASRLALEMPSVSTPLQPLEAWNLMHAIEGALADLQATDGHTLPGKIARICFRVIWDRIHKQDHARWEANPQVWRVRFSLANDGRA
jgi:hypothetical protein